MVWGRRIIAAFHAERDLVVVGAGAAGLAAAKTARKLGLAVIVLEAKDRIGGRAHTDHTSFGVPFDRGCNILHSARVNPFTSLADEYGFTYRRRARLRHIHLGDRWATPGERRSWARFARRELAAVEQAGAAGRDVAASAVTERESRWTPLLDAWIAVITSVDSPQVSALDFADYLDTGENWPLRDGYGALLARYGADVPVELSTPASRIAWHGPGVAVETPRGRIDAAAVVVTASTGVLAAEAIRFEPPLPDWKRAAIESLPTGHANKIAVQFDRDVLGVRAPGFRLLSQGPDGTITFQICPFGWNMAIGYVGGGLSAALETAGADAAAALAIEHLTRAFGGSVARHVRRTAFTGWTGDPWIRGAYSAALPGHGRRRADLARPLADRVFFAGEATSPQFFSTAHGAYLSGCAAAEAAARALGRSVRRYG